MSEHIPPAGPKVKKLANDLIGTAGMGDLVDRINDLSIVESKQLDMLAFECVGCAYWFAITERHDVGDEWFCGECSDDQS